MTTANQPQRKGQPTLAELMSGYLKRQSEAHAEGLTSIDTGSEVQPYEAGPVQPIDAKPAWEEAVAVLKLTNAANGVTLKAPPTWPSLVAAHEPAYDLALCLGNFPQLVRNLQPLLAAKDLTKLRQVNANRPAEVSSLNTWAEEVADKQQFPQVLLALGTLRLAKQYDLAARLIEALDHSVPTQWQALWHNEKAALAWHRGDVEEARQLWQAQPVSTPVLFNRGMSALFSHRPEEARDNLNQAVSQLPETSAWHHLARLYLTLAESRAK